jgi:hypothetical protein
MAHIVGMEEYYIAVFMSKTFGTILLPLHSGALLATKEMLQSKMENVPQSYEHSVYIKHFHQRKLNLLLQDLKSK